MGGDFWVFYRSHGWLSTGTAVAVLLIAQSCKPSRVENRRSAGNDGAAEALPAPTPGPLDNDLSEEELRKAFAATLEKYRKAPQQEYAQSAIARSLQTRRSKSTLNIRMKGSVSLVAKTAGLIGFADQSVSIRAAGGQITKTLPQSNVLTVDFPSATDERYLAAVIDFLKSDSRIDVVEPDYLVRAIGVPNDTRFGELWGLRNLANGIDIKAVPAWDITTGSRNVIIGVIDSGIDCTHPDLAVNCWVNPGESGVDSNGINKRANGIDDDNNGYVDDWQGWNFAIESNNAKDDNSHGTHVAGTIGASGNNNQGVTGVNWQVSLVPLKFLSSDGSGYISDALEAIDYATRMRMFATNNSWGGGGYSALMQDAIRRARDAGVFFVAAAGNDANDNDASPSYPSNHDVENVIAVAAVNSSGALASFSSFGRTTVDLAGPGVGILSTTPGNQYASYNGTSMATPHVTGILGLLKARYPQESMTSLKSRLFGSTSSLPSLAGKVATGGMANVANALNFTPDLDPPSAPGPISIGDQDIEAPAPDATSANTTGVANLTFTCSGDDGRTGYANRYEFRIAESRITTDAEWNSATVLNVLSSSTAAGGTSGSAVVSGITPGFNGYMAARAFDEAGNPSPISASTQFTALSLPVRKTYDGNSLGEMLANNGWITELDPDRGTVYSDGAGSYAPNANKTITLQHIPIAQAQRVVLQYWSSISLETGFDFARVIVRGVPGTDITPITVDQMTGYSPWTLRNLDLTNIALQMAAAGATALQIDFQMTSDWSIQYQGWLLDDINVRINDSIFLVSGAPQGDSTSSTISISLTLPGTSGGEGMYSAHLQDISNGFGVNCADSSIYSATTPSIPFSTPFTASQETSSEKFLCLRAQVPGVKYPVHAWRSWRYSTSLPLVTGSGFPTGVNNSRSFTLRALAESGTFPTSWSYALVVSPPTLVTAACLDSSLSWSSWLPMSQSAAVTVPYAPATQQTMVLCMRGRSDAGTVQATPKWYSWTSDFDAPVMLLSDLPATRNNLRSFEVSIQGPTDIDACMARLVGGEASACPVADADYNPCTLVPTKWTVLTSNDGTHTLCVRGRDKVGNKSSTPTTFTWTRQTVPPTAEISGNPPTSTSNPDARITVSGARVVTYKMVLAASDAGCTTWSGPIPVATAIQLSLTPGGDGPRVLCVKGLDDLGNEQLAPTIMRWTQDTVVAPIAFIGQPSDPSNTQRLDVSVNAGETGNYRYAISAGNTCDTQRLAAATPRATTVKITDSLPLADGTYNVCAAFTDAAGNTQTSPTTWTWVKDTMPPVTTLSSLPPGSTTDPAISVTVGGAGATSYQWAILSGAVTCANAQYGSFVPIANVLSANAGLPGAKLLCVRGRDLAGNIQANATYHAWTLTAPPTPTPTPVPVQAVLLSGGLLSPNNVGTLSVTIGGTGVTQFQLAMVRSQNTDCPANVAWGPWKTVSQAATAPIPTGNSFWTLCIRGKSTDGRIQATPTIHRWLRFAGAPVFSQATVFGAIDRGAPAQTAESLVVSRTQSLTPPESVRVYLCKLTPETGVVSNCNLKTVSFAAGVRQMTVNYSGVGSGSWVAVGLPYNSLRGRIRHLVFSK